jgi:hypothetical protein
MIVRMLFLELWIGVLRRGLYISFQLYQRLPTRLCLADYFVLLQLLMDNGNAISVNEDHLILFLHLRFIRVVLADLI